MAYRLDWSGVMKDRVRELYAEAVTLGQGHRFREGLRSLADRMEQDPHDLGEICYHTGLGHPVRVAGADPLVIDFVIYESLQTVCPVKVTRLSGRGE
jgi:hypothetical protein